MEVIPVTYAQAAEWFRTKSRNRVQFPLHFEQTIVFREPFGARYRSNLDLSRAGSNREIGEEIVFGFPGTRRHHCGITAFPCAVDHLECLGQGADLVHLHENSIRRSYADALFQTIDIGGEQVVANDLNF